MKLNKNGIPLYIPRQHPRGVIESYLTGVIEITVELVNINKCKLDKKGLIRYSEFVNEDIEVVLGFAHLAWKNDKCRKECIEIQKIKNKNHLPGESRWTEVKTIVSALEKGSTLPFPTLLHPKLYGGEGLKIIDGARRILANIEAHILPFHVAVIQNRICE